MESLSLIGVGLFREFNGWRPQRQSIADAMNFAIPLDARRRMSFYLALGTHVVNVMGSQPDVVDGEEVALTGAILSDGDFFWRQDLAHYVLKYGLDLPAEFVENAHRNGWRPPVLTESEIRHAVAHIQLAKCDQ